MQNIIQIIQLFKIPNDDIGICGFGIISYHSIFWTRTHGLYRFLLGWGSGTDSRSKSARNMERLSYYQMNKVQLLSIYHGSPVGVHAKFVVHFLIVARRWGRRSVGKKRENT